MACPTCGHTISLICKTKEDHSLFACGRCGTVKVVKNDRSEESVFIPMLVDRCRKFGATLGRSWGQLWIEMGIEESVFPEGQRRDVGSPLDLTVREKVVGYITPDPPGVNK